MKGHSASTKGLQAIATEATEYSKTSFEESIALVQKLSGVRSAEAAFELQTNYVKASFEGFFAEATTIGEMYADLAKYADGPYEAPMPRRPLLSRPRLRPDR